MDWVDNIERREKPTKRERKGQFPRREALSLNGNLVLGNWPIHEFDAEVKIWYVLVNE
jgi:hypothetical protein